MPILVSTSEKSSALSNSKKLPESNQMFFTELPKIKEDKLIVEEKKEPSVNEVPPNLPRLETPRNIKRPYMFKFSTRQEVGATSNWFKFFVLCVFLIYCSIYPMLFFFGPQIRAF